MYNNKEQFISDIESNFFDGAVFIETDTREIIIETAELVNTIDDIDHIVPSSDKYACHGGIPNNTIYNNLRDIASVIYDYLIVELKEQITLVRF